MSIKKFFTFTLTVFAILMSGACTHEAPNPRQVSVSGAILSKTSLTLNLWVDEDYDHRTAILSANVLPKGTNQAVIWLSDNNNIAMVENGLVSAIGKGTASIIAVTKEGGFTASCSVLVVEQEPGPVEGVSISKNNMTFFLGSDINRLPLTPVFSPIFVSNEAVTWTSSNSNVARVTNKGVVNAMGAGTAVITVTTVDGGFKDTCTVTVSPPLAQFAGIADFLNSGYYKSGFDFGTDPVAKGDRASNTSTWTGGNSNNANFTLNSPNYNLFGRAGAGNLVPQYSHQSIQSGGIASGPYRSHTQLNYAAMANYAFSGYRQAHPWGVNTLTATTTRAGQTWTPGAAVYAANISTVQYSGIGVDLGSNIPVDLVFIYAGANINYGDAFNSVDINSRCPGITLEYMPDTNVNAQAAFNKLYKANLLNVPTNNWSDPDSENNWPPPGYSGSPWMSGGKIVPDGKSWVYVFHFEEPVLARFLRCNFEQTPVAAPATGYYGRAFVNSFEVYNTRE